MPDLVQDLLQQFTTAWWNSDTHRPALPATFTAQEQAAREAHLDRFTNTISAEMRAQPRTQDQRRSAQQRIMQAFATFSSSALDFQERHLDVLLHRGFPELGVGFAQMARRFDPTVAGSDVFQASRNAWTMSGLQVLLGQPIQLTPAIFAYSMLYPYSDNYLDDPNVPEATKRDFNARFARRLQGEPIAPANDHERKICDLVAMIEGQYDRGEYPQVFESLLAIHSAQCKSLELLHRAASPYEVDVLGISLEKGGTSVLADGYLVAGSLTRPQAELTFGFGAFLQIVDDLQDVEGDTRDGLLTVFSQTAGRWPLDGLTNRCFHFARRVLQSLACVEAPGAEPLKELMQRSSVMLLTNAAGAAGRFYSRLYLQELEGHSPFRFAALAARRKKLSKERVSLMRLIEAFATPTDAEFTFPEGISTSASR